MPSLKLEDIANKTGVSITTVSLVLNGKGKISDKVAEKVRQSANELGYRKNIRTSSKSKNKILPIGVLIHEDFEKEIEWRFIRSILIQLETVISKKGYYPVLILVNLESRYGDIFNKVISIGVSGLFSIHYVNERLFTELESYGIPVLLINNSSLQNKFYTVCCDDFQGAYEAAVYLLNLNHKNIAFLQYPRPDMPDIEKDMLAGLKKALGEHNLEFDDSLHVSVNLFDMDDINIKVEQLISRSGITAVLAIDDYLAAKIIVALRNVYLKVPEDISIIAPGDILDYNEPFIQPITTVQLDTGLLGRLSSEMMIGRLNDESSGIQVLKVKNQLIIRGSCRKI